MNKPILHVRISKDIMKRSDSASLLKDIAISFKKVFGEKYDAIFTDEVVSECGLDNGTVVILTIDATSNIDAVLDKLNEIAKETDENGG